MGSENPLPLAIHLPRQVSKKQHIYDALRTRIQEKVLPVGTRLPSTSELAKEWCVAHATAHAALAELTRDGWVVRYPKHGTFVSTPPQKGDTAGLENTAVLVLPPREEIDAAGNGAEVFDILQGLTEGARAKNWQIQIESVPGVLGPEHMARAVESIRRAAIAIFVGTQYQALVQQLNLVGFSTVSLGHDVGCGDVVTYDRHASITTAVRHLVSRGCGKIGYFGNVEDPTGKYATYLQVMEENGLPVVESRNCHCPNNKVAAKMIARFLNKRLSCDGLFVGNYRMGSAFAREAIRRGVRIPGDLSLVAQGIKVHEIDSVPINYVRIPYMEYGYEAMRIIAERRRNKPVIERTVITLKPELIEETPDLRK